MTPKRKVFSKVKAIKDAARANIGTPKPTRTILDAKAKAEMHGDKHKRAMGDRLEEG